MTTTKIYDRYVGMKFSDDLPGITKIVITFGVMYGYLAINPETSIVELREQKEKTP